MRCGAVRRLGSKEPVRVRVRVRVRVSPFESSADPEPTPTPSQACRYSRSPAGTSHRAWARRSAARRPCPRCSPPPSVRTRTRSSRCSGRRRRAAGGRRCSRRRPRPTPPPGCGPRTPSAPSRSSARAETLQTWADTPRRRGWAVLGAVLGGARCQATRCGCRNRTTRRRPYLYPRIPHR
jgi:hypothetical protein